MSSRWRPASSIFATVDALRAVALRFGPRASRRAKTRALVGDGILRRDRRRGPSRLPRLPAVPRSRIRETRALRDAARRELRRIASAPRELFDSGPARTRAKLANTGIAGTDVTINFGWDIARWLVERFPRQADIDSFGERGLPPQEVVGEALAAMEFELGAARRDAARISSRQRTAAVGARASPGSSTPSLRLHCTDALRSQLFDAMQPFIVIRPGRSMLSRTFARGLPTPYVLPPRRSSRAASTSPRSSTSPLPAPRRLSARRAPTCRRCRPRGAGGPRPRNRRHRARLRRGRALLRSSRAARRSRSTRCGPIDAARSIRTSA